MRQLAVMPGIVCVFVWLACLWAIVLYDEYYPRAQMAKLCAELDEAWAKKVHACQGYLRQVRRARELLLSGKRGDAIVQLEEAITLAQAQRVIPLRGTRAPTFGEILLLRLYDEEAAEGRSLPGRQSFWRYMESAYPEFSGKYSEYKRLWDEFVEHVSRDGSK
ncbi:hypothetical protein [Thermogutta sp.]|uniref:hypothetical protein n=1 Tax=Thermogutta sp. TaxID=1962930 RepID=UPI00321F9280